jgi:polar amino acid transport system substrate-binding protein
MIKRTAFVLGPMIGGIALMSTFLAGPASGMGASQGPSSLLPATIKAAGAMTLGTDADWPVCEYIPSNSKTIIGFEPSVWNAVGSVLGIKVNVVNVTFTDLIPGVESGRFNAAAECIVDNATREKVVTFVDFGLDKANVYVLKSNPHHVGTKLTSLCGLSTATQTGTATLDTVKAASKYCTKHGKPKINNVEYPSFTDVQLALYDGRADFILDTSAAGAYMVANAPTKVVRVTMRGSLPKFYDGVVFNKNEKQLRNAFLSALKTLFKSGQYAKIMKRWKISTLKIKAPGINLAHSNPLPKAAI